MAEKSVLKPTPIVYRVGDDISEEKFNELIQKLGDWFAEIRNTKEPVKLAKHMLDCCLRGVKPSDGQPWDSAATATLAKRIRMLCRYDLETMQPLQTADEKTKKKKQAEKDRKIRKQQELKQDQNYPKEFGLAATKELSYGDDPAGFFTTAELERKATKKDALLKQFPQLDNVANETKVEMWLTLQLLFERLQFRRLQSSNKKEVGLYEEEMQGLTKQIVDLEKAMGIDPVTVSKMQKEREGGTIGDAVRRFDTENWREVRLRLWAEELLLVYQMFMRPSPRTDMGGYQLDEVGLYGLVKTRVTECPRCGERNFGSFSIEEIEQWLLDNGLLKLREDLKPGQYLQLPQDLVVEEVQADA